MPQKKMTTSKKRTASSSTKKKTSAGSAAKSKTKKSTARKTAPEQVNYKSSYEKHRKSKRQMSAVLLFTAGVLLFALMVVPGMNVWRWIHDFLFGMGGATVLIIPVSLVYIAVMTTLDKLTGEIHNKVWQTLALTVFLCGLIEVVQSSPFYGDSIVQILLGLYTDGTMLSGGGLLSALIGWPLYLACGQVGAVIILLLALFAFLMLLTGATLIGLFRSMAKPVKKMEESYVARREEQELLEEEERNGPRFNVDVSLDNMPQHPVSAPKPTLQELLELEKKTAKEAKSAKDDAKEPQIILETQKEPQNTAFSIDPNIKKEAEVLVEQALASAEEPPQDHADTNGKEDDQTRLYTDENNQLSRYVYPPVGLLKAPQGGQNRDVSNEQAVNGQLLVDTLKSFGVQTKIVHISRGPTVTRYELQPSSGVKISKITGLADDIALNLAASGVRIEAPIPGKPAVGIEVPNRQVDIVTMRELIDTSEFESAKSKLSVGLGRDIAGNCVIADIAKMPHMLIAGSTGSGKSVCINSIIISLLYKASPSEVRFLMIDPKVVELGIYNGIPHLLVPVVTDPRKAAGALGWAVTEMLKRYNQFAENNVRDLKSFNALAKDREDLSPMPQIVIIIDELSDLMMAAPKEVEDAICRLAQMARAAGMHLIIATQRPSVDVVTGLIKANVPSRIAFAVSSQIDSRTILDSGGAEKLLGRGDMLYAPVGMPKPLRVQGCYVSDKEVEQVVNFIKNKESAEYDNQIMEEIEKQAVAEKPSSDDASGGGFSDQDELFDDAVECVVEAGQASTSYLQRKLKVGYARAARLVDEMEEQGIIGPFEGSKPRTVLISRQQWIEMRMNHDKQTKTE